MISEIKLVNFRNIESLSLKNLDKHNFIIGENWKWKTNILEALSLLWNNTLIWLSLDELVKKKEDYFFIEYKTDSGEKFSLSYDKEKKKRVYTYNNNKTTKAKFFAASYKCVTFAPILMNLMYLAPNLRRDFLDNILKSSFPEYDKLLSDYKKIVKSRNKLLKNIAENKSTTSELEFWDEKFINLSSEIYKYRFKIVNFFSESIKNSLEYFSWKIEKIEFLYKTKVSSDNITNDIKEYLKQNYSRDIILWRTYIWPHIDDFDIIIDSEPLSHFASRGETKSIIIWLKLLEGIFIEKMTWNKPILLIDDLLSELDEKHEKQLLKKIEYYQSFISSIDIEEIDTNIIRL